MKHFLPLELLTHMRKKRVDGVLIKILMKEYGLSKASVYRYLEQAESD